MKRILFIFAFFTMLSAFGWSQGIKAPKISVIPADTLVNDSLIISELYMIEYNAWGYVELTNMSSKTLDLNNYFITWRNMTSSGPFEGDADKGNLFGTLAPGKSFVFGCFRSLTTVDAYGHPLFPNNGNVLNQYIFPLCDTITDNSNAKQKIFSLWARKYNNVTNTVDSVRIENFNGKANLTPYNLPIAGIAKSDVDGESVTTAALWIRKSNIKRGNAYRIPAITTEEAWNNSRGTDEADSEWIPIPKKDFYYTRYSDVPFTTIKNHGIGSLTTIKPLNGIAIDLTKKMITMPYGIRRDSVFRNFTYGPNIAWMYKINGDSSKYYTQTGDSIFFYALGNSSGKTGFRIETLAATASFNLVAPRLYLNNSKTSYKKDYEISQGAIPMDSISYVPYACRIDTFIKNLIFEAGSSYNFSYTDGIERPDLKTGDILTVTSQSGLQKAYKISIVPYIKSDDALIKTIIFPGLQLWTNTSTYLPTDTMFSFNSSIKNSTIQVPLDMDVCPEVIPVPNTNKSKIKIVRAKNLNGSLSERTLTIKVTAEDGITESEYNFTFTKQLPAPQLNYTPFFSDFVKATGNDKYRDGPNQIFNPFDESLDMSDYLLLMIASNTTLDNYITKTLVTDTNKWTLRPGYMVIKNSAGMPVFKDDLSQKTVVIPAKSTYTWTKRRAWPNEGNGISIVQDPNNPLVQALDYTIFSANELPAYGQDVYGTHASLLYGWTLNGTGNASTRTVCLYKIKNTASGDSVRDGLKPMNDLMNDYELIDIVGGGWSNTAAPWKLFNFNPDGSSKITVSKDLKTINSIYRKPNVYRGNPVDALSFGYGNDTLTIKASEWVDYSFADELTRYNTPEWSNIFHARYKNHTMYITEHISYLTSPTYKISKEITGIQSISGVMTNTTVANFLTNIVKADPGMVVKVANANGTNKSTTDLLTTGDFVTSYSARGIDSVIYRITTGAFDSNISLSSSTYTVTIAGDQKNGKISGIKFGTTALDILSKLVKPSTASMILTDGKDGILSVYTLPTDSNMIKTGERNLRIADDNLYVNVKAENGDECVYALAFNTETKPFILSDKFQVVEPAKYINYVGSIVVDALLSSLKPAPGFSLKIVNKMGQDRLDGSVCFDDKVVVYDPNNIGNSATYGIKFKDDLVFGINHSKTTIEITAYPNPTSGIFKVKTNKSCRIVVTNIFGCTVYSTKTSSGEAIIYLENEPSGIYFVTEKNKEDAQTLKIIKQ